VAPAAPADQVAAPAAAADQVAPDFGDAACSRFFCDASSDALSMYGVVHVEFAKVPVALGFAVELVACYGPEDGGARFAVCVRRPEDATAMQRLAFRGYMRTIAAAISNHQTGWVQGDPTTVRDFFAELRDARTLYEVAMSTPVPHPASLLGASFENWLALSSASGSL